MVGLSAGLHKKTTERVSIELGWRMGLSPEQTPFTFGADQDLLLFIFFQQVARKHTATVSNITQLTTFRLKR